MLALDISFGSSVVTPEWCEARIAEGYELLWVDLWTGNRGFPDAARALAMWRQAGGVTGGYFCIHNGRPAAQHYAQAKLSAGDEWEHLRFVAIDCEVDVVLPSAVLACAEYIERDGQRPAVYTGYWFWHGNMGDPDDCAHLPLIDASYGVEPSLTMYRPYGGWSTCVGHQYQNTTHLDGVDVDISLFDGEWVGGEPQPQPVVLDDKRQQFVNSSNGWAALVSANAVQPDQRAGAAAEYRTMADWLEQGLV